MKKCQQTLLSIAFIICIFFTGCSSSGSKSTNDELAYNDLVNYIENHLPTLFEQEDTVTNSYYAIVDDSNTDDQILYEKLNGEIIPASEDLLNAIEALSFESNKIKSINDLYVSAVKRKLDGYLLVREGLETQDMAKIEEANNIALEALDMSKNFTEKLRDAMTEYGMKTQ